MPPSDSDSASSKAPDETGRQQLILCAFVSTDCDCDHDDRRARTYTYIPLSPILMENEMRDVVLIADVMMLGS